MLGAVIDASVAVKWTVAEDFADAAMRVLETREEMVAPAHWLAEATNAIWAKCRRGDLSLPQGEERVTTLAGAPVRALPLDRLLTAAFAIALQAGITVYDSLYIAAAIEANLPLITADRRLYDAARRVSSATWLADV
jgi:predicted nucleic acid-binding protein